MGQKINIPKDFLIQEYLIKQKSTISIAKDLGVAKATIRTYLQNYNIKCRSYNERNITRDNRVCIICDNCNKWFLLHRCRFEKIKYHFCSVKCKGEFQEELYLGQNNPNYIDGTGNSQYPNIFNRRLKSTIRQRDSHTCANCNITEKEHLIFYGSNLCIHHIDYNKQNCMYTNLITVCQQCNRRANRNRDYWYNFYMKKMELILNEQ